ncbi:MAG: hypothetical protein R3Y29_01150 [bacterium]
MSNNSNNIKTNITPETFLDYKFLSDPKVSPNGTYTAFLVNIPNVENNNYQSSIYLYDNNSDCEPKKLTSDGDIRNYQWLDDCTIMFASSKRCNEVSKKLQQGEEITQYYTICINGGEAQKYLA